MSFLQGIRGGQLKRVLILVFGIVGAWVATSEKAAEYPAPTAADCNAIYEFADQVYSLHVRSLDSDLSGRNFYNSKTDDVLNELNQLLDDRKKSQIRLSSIQQMARQEGLCAGVQALFELGPRGLVFESPRAFRWQAVKASASSLMQSVSNQVENYVAPYGSDVDLFKVKRAMTRILDPHGDLLSAHELNQATQSMRSSFVGVGVVVEKRPNGFLIQKVVPGSSAEQSQVLSKDLISAIHGQSVAGWSLDQFAEKIQGPAGTSVTLTLVRDGLSTQKRLTRYRVASELRKMSSGWRYLAGRKVGWIQVRHFFTGSDKEKSARQVFFDHLERLNKASVESLVVDLRGNTGGSLEEVVEMVGYFIPSGPVVYERETFSEMASIYSDTDNLQFFDGPLVVLVDEQAASDSEIFAGSLQQYRRAFVMGAPRTFGKGTVQILGPARQLLPHGAPDYGVRLTVGYYYLPKGDSIQEVGVRSDLTLPWLEGKSTREQDLPYALKHPETLNMELDPMSYSMSKSTRQKLLQRLQGLHRARILKGDKVDLDLAMEAAKDSLVELRNLSLSDRISQRVGPFSTGKNEPY